MRFASPSRWHKRLGVQLIFWYAVFFIGTGTAVALISYRYLSSSLRDNRRVIEAKLAELSDLGERGDLVGLQKMGAAETRKSHRRAFFIRAVEPNGQIRFLEQEHFWAEFNVASLDRLGPVEGWQYLISKRHGDVLEMYSKRFANGLYLQVGKTVEDRREILAHYRDTVIGIIAGMTLFGLTGGAFLAFRALRPIRNVNQAMQSIVATGRVNARVPESGVGDDLDQLTRLFNQMLGRIEALIKNMRDALDNVAHDLRTPLARIRGEAEVALHNPANVEQSRDALASNIEESDKLLALLNSLMDISEAESGSLRLQIEPVRLRDLIDEVVDLYDYPADEAQVKVEVKAAGNIVVGADRARLRQVLANLLDNAIKYSPIGSKIYIEAEQTATDTRIVVKDQGCGIGADEISKIWERLYRGDKSRSHPGLGLGLSIVRAVVHAHGGKADVQSTLGEGSLFSITLPAAHSA